MPHSNDGTRSVSPTKRGLGSTRLRAATAVVMTAVALAACSKPGPGPRPNAAAELRNHMETGLALYGDGEFAVAAPHFAHAAQIAAECGEPEVLARARSAECMAWLRARNLAQFSGCTERLAPVQRRLRQSDPGRNTLVALGAVAARRPLPNLRLPDAVRPLVQDVAREFR